MFSRDFLNLKAGELWGVRVVNNWLCTFLTDRGVSQVDPRCYGGISYRGFHSTDEALRRAAEEVQLRQANGFVEIERSLSRRCFESPAGGQQRFWAVELEGACLFVHFGRLPPESRWHSGPGGQVRAKDYASPEEARRAYHKQIGEKLKEGYVECHPRLTAYSTPPESADASSSPKKAASARKPRGGAARVEEPATAGTQPEPAPAELRVSRVIDLEPRNWFLAPWRRLQPLVRPASSPFDRKDCLARLSRIPVSGYGWDWHWERAGIADALSREEAHFWFVVMVGRHENKTRPGQLAKRLADHDFTGNLSLEEAWAQIESLGRFLPPLIVLPLAHLFTPGELVELICGELHPQDKYVPNPSLLTSELRRNLLDGFRRHVVPYLREEEADQLRARVRHTLAPAWQPASFYEAYPPEVYLAAMLGLHRDVEPVVRGWADDRYAGEAWHDHYQQPQWIVFGLGGAKEVEAEMRRLNLRLREPDHVRAWLAHTELAALDHVRDNVRAETNKEKCAALLETLALAKAPEAAPAMLDLYADSKAPQVARTWLQEQEGNAIAGLIPVAAGRGRLAEAAVDFLRRAKRRGHETFIRECLAQAPADVADKVRREVLEHVEPVYEPLAAETTPDWLREAAQRVRATRLPDWVLPSEWPPLLVAGRRLNDEQTQAVVQALRESKPAEPHPLVAALRKHGDPSALDAFAWRAFESWLREGAPPREKWALVAVGLLGGDASALKLAPLIRAWPGESQHQRAVLGLECLRGMGSDAALMQLNGIAQKVKFKGLQNKARAFMEAIAQDRGMSRTELEDRIVPDCGLDECGHRVFDFGPRRFQFVLAPEMKPMVRDESGKLKADLPKPGTKDDAAQAAQAVQDWKLLKKQVREVAKLQAGRLEQAMVTGRRWTVPDFEALLVRHPLMTVLVRLLLWGGYDAAGKLQTTFRVTEERDYADVQDEPLRLDGVAAVGIVHPLQLSPAERAAWGEVLSDYEIIPPFPQLGRPIHTLHPGEETGKEFDRFRGLSLPALTLVGTLERLGWVRGMPEDAGIFHEHSKPFPGGDVTAVVEYEVGVPVGAMTDWEDQKVTRCFLVPGMYKPGWYPRHENALPLGRVDPVILSEVLADLHQLAAKAT